MLKPVFDLHIGHILKMLDIVGYNGQSFCKGVGCNDHIKLINRLAYLSERVLDSTIYLTMSVKGKYCESFCQFSDLLQFFFKILFLPFLGQISTIIKLMHGDHRDTTLKSSNFQYMLDYRRDTIEEVNQDIRVEEILSILHRCT